MQDFVASRSREGENNDIMKLQYEDIFEKGSTQPPVLDDQIKRYSFKRSKSLNEIEPADIKT